MSLPKVTTLTLEQADGVLNISLNRPHKRNAMNSAMVADIMAVVDAVADNRAIRVLVLRGAGGHFCAGGDISDMNKDSTGSNNKDVSWQFNRSFGHMISKVNRAPQLVICLAEGSVLGGGFGLACVSDIAIADTNAVFAMPETSLGVIPAQIAPFVVARVGLTQARRLALSGERVTGSVAKDLGIVHHCVTSADQMQQKLAEVVHTFKRCAPNATAITKQLILDAAEHSSLESLLDRASDDFATAMTSTEGQEGTAAFIEKRKPSWFL